MVGPLPATYLQEDEEPVVQARRHPLSVVDGFVNVALTLGVFTAGLLIVAFGFFPPFIPGALALVGGGALVGLASVFLLHRRRVTSLYTVTAERVYMAYGRIRFTMLQTTYDKVTDLHVHQSVFGRIWGFGTVKVQTAGVGLALTGVRDPLRMKRAIEDERERFIRALVDKGRPTKRTSAAPAAAGTALWNGSPALASFVGNGIGATILFLVGLASVIVGILIIPQLLFLSLAVFLGAGLTLLGAWIQYRFQAFEVTSTGVVLRKGWLSRRRIEATFAKVTDVAVNQDIMGRLLGYGSITINTAGSNEAPVVFAGVKDPDEVKRVVDEARGAA